MLARKLDDYYQPSPWEIERQQFENERFERQQAAEQARQKANKDRLLRIIAVFSVIAVTYLTVVIRSLSLVGASHELVALNQLEAKLIGSNSELKIAVEQLKGPDRIIGIAEQTMGLKVARNNIYVKASADTAAKGTMVVAKK